MVSPIEVSAEFVKRPGASALRVLTTSPDQRTAGPSIHFEIVARVFLKNSKGQINLQSAIKEKTIFSRKISTSSRQNEFSIPFYSLRHYTYIGERLDIRIFARWFYFKKHLGGLFSSCKILMDIEIPIELDKNYRRVACENAPRYFTKRWGFEKKHSAHYIDINPTVRPVNAVRGEKIRVSDLFTAIANDDLEDVWFALVGYNVEHAHEIQHIHRRLENTISIDHARIPQVIYLKHFDYIKKNERI